MQRILEAVLRGRRAAGMEAHEGAKRKSQLYRPAHVDVFHLDMIFSPSLVEIFPSIKHK